MKLQADAFHDAPRRHGYVDLLHQPERLSLGQRIFTSGIGARAYQRFRTSRVCDAITGKTQELELAWLAEQLSGSRTVLDVPAGQGNFTVAVARVAESVIALDLSAKMLELAAQRLKQERIDNVVLVRGTALELPLEDAAVDAVSNSGGLHLYPDVPLAIREMRRVLVPGGKVAGLTFRRAIPIARIERGLDRFAGVRGFDFDALGELFLKCGFSDFDWHGERLVGWYTARA